MSSESDSGPLRPPFDAGGAAPLVSPIYPSVVYTSESPDQLDAIYAGEQPAFTYAREGHPNASALARRLDALEGAAGGLVVGSGMAAVTLALLGALRAGDHVLAGDQTYGRSLRLVNETLPDFGIAGDVFDPTDAGRFAAAIRPETKAVLVEVVSNPTIRVADVRGIARIARERGIALIVDNTFTTPRAFRAFDFGADIVVHSVTKILAGHSDVTLGYVAARDPAVAERMRILSVTMGMTPSPFDCWLGERGLLSFPLRFDRAEANAAALAEALSTAPGVRRVWYPLRADHPDHNRAVDLLGTRGSHMVSFEIAPTREAANRFVRALDGVAFAPTLGDIATTVSHPATSSHRGVPAERRAALGITEGFFRVSVGCEDPDDLARRFRDALSAG